jgi:hypothetical protein
MVRPLMNDKSGGNLEEGNVSRFTERFWNLFVGLGKEMKTEDNLSQTGIRNAYLLNTGKVCHHYTNTSNSK